MALVHHGRLTATRRMASCQTRNGGDLGQTGGIPDLMDGDGLNPPT
jgi:hypothetical protein